MIICYFNYFKYVDTAAWAYSVNLSELLFQ